jgi:hypothetical protein
MDLAEIGIVLRCICGAGMNSDMANVLFDDRGKAKIGRQTVHCPVCTAIYRHGERLKYELVPMDITAARSRGVERRYIQRSYGKQPQVGITG